MLTIFINNRGASHNGDDLGTCQSVVIATRQCMSVEKAKIQHLDTP